VKAIAKNQSLFNSIIMIIDMGLGFNIGNNLDCWGGETAWRNEKINRGFITALKNYGYKTIRLPITWADNLGCAPEYNIKESWLTRIEEIVNWCLEDGLYIIINTHHDGHGRVKSWIQNAAKNYPDNADNVKATKEQLAAVWKQIAKRFSDYPDYLILEAMNEIGFDTIWNRKEGGQAAQKAEAYRILNLLNQTFVDTVRSSGGLNGNRHLLIPGYWTDIENTCDPAFKMPSDTVNDRLILSVHYYTPWKFCNGDTAEWGTTMEDINQLNILFNKLKETFIDKGIPVILGEYNVINNKLPNLENRVRWLNAVTIKCLDLGICPVLWDNGYSNFWDCYHNMGDFQRRPPYKMSEALRQVWEAVRLRKIL
jgi:endoglucanase